MSLLDLPTILGSAVRWPRPSSSEPAADVASEQHADHRTQPSAVATGVPGQGGGHIPCGPDALFLLVFNDPAAPDDPACGYGPGWTLLACQGSTRCWSTSLAGRGAGVHADQQRAESVAATVLAACGVRLTRWHHGSWNHLPIARAAVVVDRAPSTTSSIAAAPNTAPSTRGADR